MSVLCFSLSWLREHIDSPLSNREIINIMDSIGLEIENVKSEEDIFKSIKTVLIKEVFPHPNADMLTVCSAFDGENDFQVICGAQNARSGLITMLALPGAVIPESGITLKKTKIRGLNSEGMFCSAKELSISDDSSGIIELPDSTRPGILASKFFNKNDAIVNVSVTPDRGDCMSVRGIARALSTIKKTGQLKDLPIDDTLFFSSSQKGILSVGIDDSFCPIFAVCRIDNINNTVATPEIIKKRLTQSGMRLISPVVDILNFIMLDCGQPMHAYDASFFSDNNLYAAKLSVEKNFLALNGEEYNLPIESPVILNSKKDIAALAGIIGGQNSMCKIDSTSILLESAYFKSEYIAKHGIKTGIFTESRQIFERGIDPSGCLNVLKMAVSLIVKFCGGTISDISSAGDIPCKKPFTVNKKKIDRITGFHVSDEEIEEVAVLIGCKVSNDQQNITITPPNNRHDINSSADFCEEIMRAKGYDYYQPNPLLQQRDLKKRHRCVETNIRKIVASQGYSEIVSWSFISKNDLQKVSPSADYIKVKNPMSSETEILRCSLLPGLLKAISKNARRDENNLMLFEIGKEFSRSIPREKSVTALIRSGNSVYRNVREQTRAIDFFDMKADILQLLYFLGYNDTHRLSFKRSNDDALINCFSFYIRGKEAGLIGEVRQSVARDFNIDVSKIIFAKINNSILDLVYGRKNNFEIPSDYQRSIKDFAFVVPDDVLFEDLERTIRSLVSLKGLLRSVSMFDLYRGENIEKGNKSVAFSIEIQAQDRTIEEEELKSIIMDVEKIVCERHNAVIRKNYV